MRIYPCVYRIYVNMTEKPHCPLPEWLTPLCREGAEMNCKHYRKIVQRLAQRETDYPIEIMEFVRKIAKELDR